MSKSKTQRDAFGIPGLIYIPDYLNDTEIAELGDKIDDGTIELEPISSKKHFSSKKNVFRGKIDCSQSIFSSKKHSRRVAHYGYYYSYDRTGLKPAAKIPKFLKNLVDPTRLNAYFPKLNVPDFDQVIINEYKPGQQISYHTDHLELFGSMIVCITIGQAVPINFKLDEHEIIADVQPGSMYIMSGDARYKWKHGLRNTSDTTRYSITFRTVNL